MESEGFSGVLDLSSANTKGFPAAESGTYDCELFEYKWTETKGGEGSKTPAGTPLLKVQLRCIEPENENRRFFDQFTIPPADYDKEKREVMLGMLARFLIAMGIEEDKVKDKKFKLNDTLNDLIGEPVRVTVGKERKYGTQPEDDEWSNPVKGYKPIGDGSSDSGKLL